jgi:hypothetical protein
LNILIEEVERGKERASGRLDVTPLELKPSPFVSPPIFTLLSFVRTVNLQILLNVGRLENVFELRAILPASLSH